MDDHTNAAMAFLKKLLDSSTRQGEGKMGIHSDEVTQLIREDPESAAETVLALCRADDLPAPFAQMAMAIAVAYNICLGDDSLVNEVKSAPWIDRVSAPTVKAADEEQPQPEKIHPLLQESGDTLRILEVDKDDLQSGSVNSFVNTLGLADKSPQLVAKLAELWGMCILVFPLDSDPRDVWEIPEARKFIANLHQAMPYFPGYLHFREEMGMFMVYFGCLADPEAIVGKSLNLNHSSVTSKLSESITAFGKVAEILEMDPRPVWRTILSPYPVPLVNELVSTFYKQLFG